LIFIIITKDITRKLAGKVSPKATLATASKGKKKKEKKRGEERQGDLLDLRLR
jgi:hypothetical protein